MWLIHTDKWLNENNCNLVSTIHDEVLVEAPEDRYMEAGKRLQELMIQGADLITDKLPVKCDIALFREAWSKDEEKLKF